MHSTMHPTSLLFVPYIYLTSPPYHSTPRTHITTQKTTPSHHSTAPCGQICSVIICRELPSVRMSALVRPPRCNDFPDAVHTRTSCSRRRTRSSIPSCCLRALLCLDYIILRVCGDIQPPFRTGRAPCRFLQGSSCTSACHRACVRPFLG